MPITVACEECEKKYRVPDDRAGDVIRCKACGAKIAIPEEDEDEELEPRRPAKKRVVRKKKSSGAGLILGLAIGGVTVIAVLAIGLVVLLNRGGSNTPIAQSGGANPGAIAPSPGPTGTPPAAGAAAATPAVPAAIAGGGPAGSKWSVVVDPPKTPVVWPDQPPTIDGLRGGLDKMILASASSPFAVTGVPDKKDICRVLNLATGELVGKFTDPRPEFQGKQAALKPDGLLLAVPGKFDGTQPLKIAIWDVKQGAPTIEFPVNRASPLFEWLDFGPAGELLAMETGTFDGKYETRLASFDTATGKSLNQFTLAGHISSKQTAFSPGRKFLALAHSGNVPLTIYDLPQAKIAGQIPTGEIGSGASLLGHEFSPDGTLLAVLASQSRMATITVFDVPTGDRKAQVRFPGDTTAMSVYSAMDGGKALQWLPDSSGWLVAGQTIIDCATGRVLWKLDAEPNEFGLGNYRPRFPTPAGIWIVEGKDDDGKITLIPSPWKQARELLARQSDEANLIRPGASVGLNVEVGEVRFEEKDAARQALQGAFQKRLKAEQLNAAEEQPLVLRVIYAEEKGKPLQEFKQEFSPLAKPTPNPLGTATGRSVDATNAVLEISWTDAAGETVYWTHRHAVDQTSVFMKGEITAEGVRQQMFEGLVSSIESLPLPYYLTADKDAPQLPVVHHLPHW